MLKGRALALTFTLWTALSLGSVAFKVTATQSASPSNINFPETADARPIPCHSHNDYLREYPLTDALSNGCISVEADIWQKDDMKDDLRVGHTEGSLTDDRTLKKMYVDPIVQRLQMANGGKRSLSNLQGPWNGVFALNNTQTLVLLIDFKTGEETTWSTLMNALSPLRDGGWLSYWDIRNEHFQPRPVTLVASGLAILDGVTQTTFGNATSLRREIFLDAPLPSLGSSNEYNTSNSYFASTDFAMISDEKTLKEQIAGARKLQLISRYWNAPDDRNNFQQAVVWRELQLDGIGIFNTDHLTTFKHWWNNK